MIKTLSIAVKNSSGVLARIVNLYTQRGFNIESIAAGVTENPDITRITLVVSGDEESLNQITAKLRDLIEVEELEDLTDMAFVERGLALIKVGITSENRAEIAQIIDVFRGKIVDVAKDSYIVEITGNEEKIEAFQKIMLNYNVEKVARTGRIALKRGQD